MVERTRSAEVAAAMLSVLEVQRAAAAERAAMASFRTGLQDAIGESHTGRQSVEAALNLAAEARLTQAITMEGVREEARLDALAAYHASRLQLEQVATTVRRMQDVEGWKASRLEQSEADERYLARRVWVEREQRALHSESPAFIRGSQHPVQSHTDRPSINDTA